MESTRRREDELSRVVIGAAIEVHRELGGPGLLESAYEEALVYELDLRGLLVERQRAVPIVYKGRRLATDLRVDLIVSDRLLVECKASGRPHPLFEAQTLTYLRQLDLRLGLVSNFGLPLLKAGLRRVVHDPAR